MVSSILLASYGFYGGAFGNMLSQWEQLGVFSYLLPFLLIFALIFGILSKLNLFGDSTNKSINAIIALSVSLMSLQFGVVSVFFSEILPKLGVALAVVLVLIILLGLFGNPKSKTLSSVLMWGSFAIAIFVVVLSLDIFDPSRGYMLFNWIPYDWIPFLAILVLIAVVVFSAKSPSTDPADSHFIRALKVAGDNSS